MACVQHISSVGKILDFLFGRMQLFRADSGSRAGLDVQMHFMIDQPIDRCGGGLHFVQGFRFYDRQCPSAREMHQKDVVLAQVFKEVILGQTSIAQRLNKSVPYEIVPVGAHEGFPSCESGSVFN